MGKRDRLLLLALALAASAAQAREDDAPAFIRGPILHQSYDGRTDDLLTGGLGAAGLQSTKSGA